MEYHSIMSLYRNDFTAHLLPARTNCCYARFVRCLDTLQLNHTGVTSLDLTRVVFHPSPYSFFAKLLARERRASAKWPACVQYASEYLEVILLSWFISVWRRCRWRISVDKYRRPILSGQSTFLSRRRCNGILRRSLARVRLEHDSRQGRRQLEPWTPFARCERLGLGHTIPSPTLHVVHNHPVQPTKW